MTLEARTVRVRTRHTIRHPFIKPLILRAVEKAHTSVPTPWDLYAELEHRIEEPALGVFLGIEGKEPRAIAVAVLPTSAMMIAPQVSLVYSERPRLIRMIGERLREWIIKAGYDRVMGVNIYRPDDVFMRGFRHMGVPKRLGSMIEWRFK